MSDDKSLEKLYKLSANPFSQRANPDAPIVGRKAEQAAWTKIIDDTTGQRGSSLNFVVGDYGLGKSHSLYHIKKYCDEKDDVACVFLKLMMEDPIKNFGLDFPRRVFKYLPKPVTDRLARARATGIRREHLVHFNVLAKYAARVSPFHEIITGGTYSAAEVKRARPILVPKTAEVMFEYLTVLLVMMHEVGLKTLVLCVDESEYIFSQLNEKKAALVFNAIRALYDLPDTPNLGLGYSIANIVFFFAISTAGAAALERFEKVEKGHGGPIQPLLSRRGFTISLSFLSKAETRALVTEYLHINRTTGRREANPLIPYDDGFVDYLHALTQGHPRHIIERCDYVLVDGLRERVALLTKAYAKRVFEQRGLTT